MNEHDNPHWREVQFEPSQWANIPQSASLWPDDPPDEAAELRLRTTEEIALIVQAVMVTALTPRQRQVLELYYLEERTQVEIATALGINQSTVSQHLVGKRRGSSRVGGAFRKIRKAIHKAAKRRTHSNTRYARIIHTLDQLLDQTLTHRRARTLLDTLARADPPPQSAYIPPHRCRAFVCVAGETGA
ncbi:MAG: sigma-70 family RNA polymerase sigma factor [Kiritimatiellaeota bacterium]|nr:sigma-70 family RNA polymerase sigma factor [Kiritimatiellota bacterium]